MTSLLELDLRLTQLISNLLPHNNFINIFFSFFSQKGNSIFIWIFLIVFFILFEEKKHPGLSKRDTQFIITFSLSLLIQAMVVNVILKNIFQRPRPFLTEFNCPADFSFPSGHAATAFASAAVLSYFDKKRKGFYYLVASLIGLSRIYLSCHFFFDVVAGGLIGYLIARFVLACLKSHSNKKAAAQIM